MDNPNDRVRPETASTKVLVLLLIGIVVIAALLLRHLRH